MRKTTTSLTISPELLEYAKKNINNISAFLERAIKMDMELEQELKGMRYIILKMKYNNITEEIKELQRIRRELKQKLDMLELEEPALELKTFSKMDIELLKIKATLEQAEGDMIKFPKREYEMQIPIENWLKQQAERLGLTKEQLMELIEGIKIVKGEK